MANEYPEHLDAETELLKGLNRVKTFEGEFTEEMRSLKERLGALEGRIESLELMAFQDQLDRLDERINEISSDFIEVKREVYKIRLFVLGLASANRMHYMGHVRPTPKTWERAESDCTSEIKICYVQAGERIEHCEDTKDMNGVVSDFSKKTNETLKTYGFPVIGELGL
jgi:hypothetical protein